MRIFPAAGMLRTVFGGGAPLLTAGALLALAAVLAVTVLASADYAYAHPNPPGQLVDINADHPGHLILESNNRPNHAVFRLVMHEAGRYTVEPKQFDGSGNFRISQSVDWPPGSGSYLRITHPDYAWTDTASGSVIVRQGGDVLLHTVFYGIAEFSSIVRMYDAYARVDSITHDSAAVTVTFADNATYDVTFEEKHASARFGSSTISSQQFQANSTGFGHTETFIATDMNPGRYVHVLVNKAGESRNRYDIYADRQFAARPENPVASIGNITVTESGASVNFTGNYNGSIAVRLRDINTGMIVNSTVAADVQSGATYTIPDFGLLQPDTVHRYDFAREADGSFDGAGSVSGFFKTAPRQTAPLVLGMPERLTVGEGGTTTYDMPHDNPENHDMTWSIISGQTGDAAIDPATGRFTWTPGEEHGSSTPHVFVIEAEAYVDRIKTVLHVLVNETNTAPRFAIPAEYAALTGLPFTVRLSATDDDIPGQRLTYGLADNTLGATISGNTISWMPDSSHEGSRTLEATVRDDYDPPGSDQITLNVSVKPPVWPEAPDSIQNTRENEILVIRPAITDEDGTAAITAVTNGSLGWAEFNATEGTITYTPRPLAFGDDEITYTATDDDGLTATGRISIRITEIRVPPSFELHDRIVQTGRHLTFLVDVEAPESRTLEFSLAGAPPGAGMHENRFDWTPDTAGTHTFNITVTDDGGFATSNRITVRVVDDTSGITGLLPVANDIYLEIEEDTPTEITGAMLLANDLYDTMPSVTILPDRQNLEVSGTGPYTVTPDTDYNGIATFGYATGNGTHGNATVIVNVTAVDDQLVLPMVGNQTIDETEPFEIFIAADDPDDPHDVGVTLQGAPPGMEISGRILKWTPTEAQGPGEYMFTIVASGGGNTRMEQVTFTVNEINNAPIFDDIQTHYFVPVGQTVTLQVSATDSDGDPVTYRKAFGDGGYVGRIGEYGEGTVTLNQTTGEITWEHTRQGIKSVLIEAVDGSGAESEQLALSFRSVQPNGAPSIEAVPNATIMAGKTLTFLADASDRDDDAEDLLFSLQDPPAGASINATSGLFRWAPGASQAGVHAMTVAVSDGQLESYANFTVTVLDAAPPDGAEPAANNDRFRVDEDAVLTLDVADLLDNDLPGDAEFVSVESRSPGLRASHAGGVITITPESNYFGLAAISYTIMSGGGSASADIMVDVAPVDDPITFYDRPWLFATIDQFDDKTIRAGKHLTFRFLVQDFDGDDLEFSLAGAPDGASLKGGRSDWPSTLIQAPDGTSLQSKRFDWTPTLEQAGTDGMTEYEMTLTVTDGTHVISDSFTVTVIADSVTPDRFVANNDYFEIPQDTIFQFTPELMQENDLVTHGRWVYEGTTSYNAGRVRHHVALLYLDNAFQLFLRFDPDRTGMAYFVYSSLMNRWPDPNSDNIHLSAMFNVTKVGMPPVLYGLEAMTATERTPFRFALPAADPDTPTRDLVFGAEGAPEGLQVSDGWIEWTPPEHAGPASYTFDVTVSDETGTARQEAVIDVVKGNSPPVFEDIGTLHGTLVGVPLRLTFNATDTDMPEQTVTYTAVSNATEDAPVVGTDGRLIWIPERPGTQAVTVTATDNHDPPANASITVVLRAADFSIAPDSATSDRLNRLHIHAVDNDNPPGVFIANLYTENFTAGGVPDLGRLDHNGTHVEYVPSAGVWQLPDGTSASFVYEIGHRDAEATLNSSITITFESGAPDADARDDIARTRVAVPVPIDVLANDTHRTQGPPVGVEITRLPANGMATVTDSLLITYAPNASYAGTDTFGYAITDRVTGTNDTATVTVSVVNTPPEADNFGLATTPGGTVSRDLINGSHVRDPDGNGGLTAEITREPGMGDASAGGTVITYTARGDADGDDTFGYTVTDVHGDSASGMVTVRVSPEVILVANNDTARTAQNVSVDIPVLDNDSISPEDTPVVIVITGLPEMGEVDVIGTTIRYDPPPGISGNYTIEYRISADNDTSGEATVHVAVEDPPQTNTPPTADSFDIEVAPSETRVINLAERGSIADDQQEAGTLEVAINDVPARTQGNASVAGTVITYTAYDNATGDDTISYTVTDGGGLSDTGRISITISAPVIAPPVLEDISNMTVEAGGTLAFSASTRDANPGQTLTYGFGGTVPAGAAINATGYFSWTPFENQTGDHPVNITVSNAAGSDSTTFTITVTAPDAGGPNQDPAAPDILINAELFFPSAVTPAVTDPDGDDITITRVSEPTLGVLDTSMLPQISYTPSQTGIERLNYTASDGRRGTDTGTITIFINPEGNARPVLEHIYNTGGRVGVDLNFTAAAADGENDPLTFDLANAPDGASITAGGDFSWRPTPSQNGTHTVTFVVHDDSGGADWQHVTINILRENETNLPPVPQDIDAGVVLGGGRGFQPVINDPENDVTEIVRVYDSSLGDVDRSFTSQGIIVYIAGVLGSDEVIYTVSDGRGGFANGTISITVEEPANVRPLIEFVGDKSVNAGDELTFAVDARDLDGLVTGFELEGATQGPSMSPLGVFSWTPTANDVGRHEFTILVFDDAGDNSTVSITVTVRPEGFENSPPVAPDVVIMTPQDVLSIVRPTLTDPDEGDPVRISGTGQTTKGSILSGFLRAGIIIYLPNQGESGTEMIPYTIADSSDGNDTATINVFISARGNTDPILGSIDFRNINAGDPLAFDLEAEDPDDDAISYLPVGAPDNIEISPEGAFSWTSAAADVGNHTFTIVAYDDRGGADSKTAVIRVLPAGTANQAPNAPDSTVTVAPGGSIVITPAISDPDGDRVTITDAVASGTGVVIYSEDSMNYVHVATTPTETITYTVTDARGATSTGTITITIR